MAYYLTYPLSMNEKKASKKNITYRLEGKDMVSLCG